MSDIIGYKPLSDNHVYLINLLKEKEEEILCLIERIRVDSFVNVDLRWLNISITDTQKGFMAAVRSIASGKNEP
jgi:hypothetical protein